MQKILVRILIIFSLFTVQTVNALSIEIPTIYGDYYLGLEMARVKYSFSSVAPITNAEVSRTYSFSPFIGFRFHKNFASEFGYGAYLDIKPVEGSNQKLDVYNVYWDILARHELERHYWLIGTFGFGMMKAEYSWGAQSKIFSRVGVGAEYNFPKHFINKLEGVSMRAMFRWQKVGREANMLKNSTSFVLGITYML